MKTVFTLLLATILSLATAAAEPIDALLDDAAAIEPLETVIVSVDGRVIASRGFDGHTVDEPTNIKSASKSVISALVGIAIGKGLLEGPDQPIATVLKSEFPDSPDPRLRQITIGHLLSMQAGLDRTSGGNYGRWVASPNWVRAALAQPFVDDPGGRMLYSTGSTHLLSAILTRVSGRSTLELARDWIGEEVKPFRIASWDQDPQGIYFGGNQMAMSPRSLLAFGELYRNGGRAPDGSEVIPADWIALSWRPRTSSAYTGDGYGYGWFTRRIGGFETWYAWGYGGQMLYVMPDLDLTVVMTSDPTEPSARTGHRDDLHDLMAGITAVVAADRSEPEPTETRQLDAGACDVQSGDGAHDVQLQAFHPSDRCADVAADRQADSGAGRRPADPPSVDGEVPTDGG